MTWGFPKIRGTLLEGPYNEDCSSLGSSFGVPLFWETTTWLCAEFFLQTHHYTPLKRASSPC